MDHDDLVQLATALIVAFASVLVQRNRKRRRGQRKAANARRMTQHGHTE